MNKSVSLQALQRMPTYLSFLKKYYKEHSDGSNSLNTELHISAKVIAEALNLGEIQVRKDLAAVSENGKPKVGYVTIKLIKDIEKFLGYDNPIDAVLIGAGKLGRALLSYSGFKDYGLNIIAAFDIETSQHGTDESGKLILPLDKLKDLCKRMNIKIGIITVPSDSAQTICDLLIDSGIIAIWNFAPTHLQAPENILIKNENMAASLAILSQHIYKEH